jgi:aminoglycoside 6'-N-acetyltransferase I
MKTIIYSELTTDEFEIWFTLALKLWGDYEPEDLKKDLLKVFHAENQNSFLAKCPEQGTIGFINVSVRNDYVEGADNTPTGYLEGIYVEPEYRNLGVAKQLVTIGAKWLYEMGCRQMGSDTGLENKDSQEFHKKAGFREEAVLVHFLKDIKQEEN